ncbi:thiaminase II [Clostridium sp. CM028]|uniref:thiaminase II n=1 Tax=unclassified Clostridium TaxID=2614128 RepID=UPI001C0CD2B4|nr:MULTISPECIES: thiaminase II [unclassified Clostridium]MBU3091963.1 thiaminase II [Clostridium sp. CF011]MBW9149516.1 thiaminase II [Clostridium sp. CM028]WAG70478.1 thiaminase II [Clostridium sp. CF011]WLC62132.1 thiaminase II [Clostridium sp. CM028]
MKFTDYIFEEVKEFWNSYLEHPFIKEIGEGTLDKEKFKNYLIQDYLYLKEYSKVFSVGLIKAKTMDEMKFYYNSIRGIMEDETAVHIKYLEGFGLTAKETEKCEYKLITTSYTSYMQGVALTGDLKEIALVAMPCTWSYSYIGKYIKKTYGHKLEGNFFNPWIEEYASEDFEKFTNDWLDYINDLCEDIDEIEKKRLLAIFMKSCMYELEFWNRAYN